MCCADRAIFHSLSGRGGVTQASTTKVYQHCWKGWAGWCAQKGVPQNAISASKLADSLLHLFRVGLAWHTMGIYHSTISAFLGTALPS